MICFVKLNFIRSSGFYFAEQLVLVKITEHVKRKGSGEERQTKQRQEHLPPGESWQAWLKQSSQHLSAPPPPAGGSARPRLQVEEVAGGQARERETSQLQGGSLSWAREVPQLLGGERTLGRLWLCPGHKSLS